MTDVADVTSVTDATGVADVTRVVAAPIHPAAPRPSVQLMYEAIGLAEHGKGADVCKDGITHLGGLDTLDKLQVLSVGNNLIAQLDNVMYLRPFTKLQAVNLVGNPFCQEDEYR